MVPGGRCWIALAARLSAAAGLLTMTAALAAGPTYIIGPISDLSGSCSGQNAEVEQTVDPMLGYVYEEWMGCQGIAFARSNDGGTTFSDPISLPGSVGSNVNSWDPALAVAPDGTVYATFMLAKGGQWYPVVAASFDHGVTFPAGDLSGAARCKELGRSGLHSSRPRRCRLHDLGLRPEPHVG